MHDKQNSIKIGKKAELLVEQLLRQSGWKILESNYRNIGFEIDIIAQKNKTLIFVEVKFRRKAIEENILPQRKKHALKRGALHFIRYKNPSYETARIDLAIISPSGGSNEATLQYFTGVN